jgi:hypothetical protein
MINGSPGSKRMIKNTMRVTRISTKSAINNLRMIYVVTDFYLGIS